MCSFFMRSERSLAGECGLCIGKSLRLIGGATLWPIALALRCVRRILRCVHAYSVLEVSAAIVVVVFSISRVLPARP